ncbi:uncharacterized protein LOC144619548 [Crassostrea virginica]
MPKDIQSLHPKTPTGVSHCTQKPQQVLVTSLHPKTPTGASHCTPKPQQVLVTAHQNPNRS